MNSSLSVGNTVSNAITEEYETLRSNALGQFNQPWGLLLFMQRGMSSWLRTLAALRNPDPAPNYAPNHSTRQTSTGTLAAILADAILEIIGPVNRGEV